MNRLTKKLPLLFTLSLAFTFTFSTISCKAKSTEKSNQTTDAPSVSYTLPDLSESENESTGSMSSNEYYTPSQDVVHHIYPDFFSEDDDVFYIYENNNWEWSFKEIGYTQALPNYCEVYKGNDKITAITINECPFIGISEADDEEEDKSYDLRSLPAGTEVELSHVVGYGISVITLYPVYQCSYYLEEENAVGHGLIRGYDITTTDNISSVSDGKGGKLTLYYQQALSVKDEVVNPSRYDIEYYLNDWLTYEKAGLRGGYNLTYCAFIYSDGINYRFYPEYNGILKLEYPLNMNNPIPFVLESCFNGGQGGGVSNTKIYTLEPGYSVSNDNYNYYLSFDFLCEYEVCNTDGGPTGTAYHYYTKDGIRTYVFQSEYGQEDQETLDVWTQDSEDPYSFRRMRDTSEVKDGNNIIKTTGSYWNPTCKLKMRSEPDKNSEALYTLCPGTLLKVLEEGPVGWIDGYYSNWVKVQMVNDDSFLEGYKSKNKTTGWVFGGYLE